MRDHDPSANEDPIDVQSVDSPLPYLRTGWSVWGLLIVLFILTVAIFYDGIFHMVSAWLTMEEYSHGIMIPAISAFLIWQKKNELARIPFQISGIGFAVLLAGLLLFFLGELSSLYIIVQYAFFLVLFGIAWATMGTHVIREIWVPLFFLFFSIRLPDFIYQTLSAKLQLISSQLGVSLIRACDISVFLEGNVIDLGPMQLQVVDACSGLRYLFPLMSLAFICAYFFRATFWKRALVFLSSIPITVLMNSFRIGVIGILVEHWGKSMAEGFLHDFEGWIVFMACTGILLAEMWALARVGKDPRPLMEVFGLTFPDPLAPGTEFREREFPKQFLVVGGLLLGTLGLSALLEHREELVPARARYSAFPMQIAEWSGERQNLEQRFIDQLQFDDYLLADYRRGSGVAPVNLYSAYYSSQRKGASIHTPRACIPGGGWQIVSHEVLASEDVSLYGQPLRYNRLLIQKGDDRQLVYYWFQQRGRNLTNEYIIKWYLFWDALTMNRTDGALVRLTTFAPKGENLAAADQRLKDFLAVSLPVMDAHIPK